MCLSWSICLIAGLAIGQGAPVSSEQVKLVETRLGRLSASDFPTRETASLELIELGHQILPHLRRAQTGDISLEARQRISAIIAAIEEKDRFGTPLRRLAERLAATKPPTPDEQIVNALYLLALDRPASKEERALAACQVGDRRAEGVRELIEHLRRQPQRASILLEAHLQILAKQQEIQQDFLAGNFDFDEPKKLVELARALKPKLAVAAQNLSDEVQLEAIFLITLRYYPQRKFYEELRKDRLGLGQDKELLGNLLLVLLATSDYVLDGLELPRHE